jgi:S1-C subfamily serine protease
VSDVFDDHDNDELRPDASASWPTPPPAADSASSTPATGPDAAAHGETWAAAPAGVTRPLRSARIVVSAVVVAAAIMLGAGLGHLVWTSTTSPRAFQGFNFPGLSFPGGPSGFTPPNDFGGSPAPGGPSNAAAIERKVDPALVDINATFNYQQAAGEGTGIVLTSNGEVLTNNHVIEGATSLSVTDVGNGRTYSATVLGYDATHDVAVLQLQGASGLTTATLGDSSKATVGEPVLAIGNAGGGGGTPTSAGGTIAKLGQSVSASDSLNGTNENLTGMIAVTADVQPGDSGGALVDANGKVLGIDTAGPAGFSFNFSGQGTASAGYAIPINSAMAIAADIESGTQTSTLHVGPTAFLGVLIATAGTNNAGARIANVVSGGTAATAGIVTGDVITSINGAKISSPSNVSKALLPLHPGDRVTLTWTTATGHTMSASTILKAGPAA